MTLDEIREFLLNYENGAHFEMINKELDNVKL